MSGPALTADAHGVFAVALTAFTDDGALDLASTDALVDFYLGHEVTGLTLLGVMGEAPKLSLEESLTLTRRVIPIIDYATISSSPRPEGV